MYSCYGQSCSAARHPLRRKVDFYQSKLKFQRIQCTRIFWMESCLLPILENQPCCDYHTAHKSYSENISSKKSLLSIAMRHQDRIQIGSNIKGYRWVKDRCRLTAPDLDPMDSRVKSYFYLWPTLILMQGCR